MKRERWLPFARNWRPATNPSPYSTLAAGTPDDIRTYVRNLIDLFQGAGLILCPGCDAPINARPENMEAFVAASHEYGRIAQLA